MKAVAGIVSCEELAISVWQQLYLSTGTETGNRPFKALQSNRRGLKFDFKSWQESKQMANLASEHLQQNSQKIMQLWEERTRREVSAAIHQTSLVLQNSLPLYLNQLADELSDTIERTPFRIAADKAESTRIGSKHGHERASFVNYSLEQVIFEYHILRQVLFEVLEEKMPLEKRERDIIIDSVEQAVNDAATQFSRTLQEIQELFTITLTHDLRGPINVAKMGAQLILRRPEKGEINIDIAGRIVRAIDRLDSMIRDLLDASRFRAGHSLDLKFEKCHLDALVKDIVEDLSFTYAERFVVVSDHPVIIYCSREEIRRVIENLATNAVKYGNPDTPITLTLQQTQTQVKLTVHNEGNPISPEAQSILFQQFRRSQPAEGQKGWGLGLFLVKSLTEAHYGIVSVESVESKGTSFIIELPKDPSLFQVKKLG